MGNLPLWFIAALTALPKGQKLGDVLRHQRGRVKEPEAFVFANGDAARYFALSGQERYEATSLVSTEPNSCPACSRRQLVGLVALLGSALSQLVLQASCSGAELDERPALQGLAEVASRLPGYGPPDIYYPEWFAGSWVCTRELVSVMAAAAPQDGTLTAQTTLTALPPELAEAAARQGEKLSYKVLFVRSGAGTSKGSGNSNAAAAAAVVADRAYNERALEEARSGGSVAAVRWAMGSPNVLSVEFAGGAVRETKVTKRSFEAPAAEAFGTSEYARIASADASAGLTSVPAISAARTLVRYRRVAPDRIEAIELVKFYPTVTLDANPEPLGVVKSRITLQRAVPGLAGAGTQS